MKRLFLLSVFVVMVANMSAQHHINFNSDWYIGTTNRSRGSRSQTVPLMASQSLFMW